MQKSLCPAQALSKDPFNLGIFPLQLTAQPLLMDPAINNQTSLSKEANCHQVINPTGEVFL
jgi:hypothetical protein